MARVALILTLVILLGAGCAKEKAAEPAQKANEPPAPANTAGPTVPPAPVTPKQADDVVIKLTAAEFEKEYKANSKATATKYDGKTLDVSGVVDYARPNYYANGTMIALAPAETFGNTISGVTKGYLPADMLTKGQKVRIRGKANGTTILTECVVLEMGPDTAVRTTAEQIAKDHTADPEKARQKYDGKTLVVKGEVSAVKPDPDAPLIKFVELKGDGQTVIHCRFGPSDEERKYVDSLKPGDKVTFATEYIRAEKGLFILGMCYPVTGKK